MRLNRKAVSDLKVRVLSVVRTTVIPTVIGLAIIAGLYLMYLGLYNLMFPNVW